MGRCISYQLTPFDVLKEADRTLWQVGETDLQLVPGLQQRAVLFLLGGGGASENYKRGVKPGQRVKAMLRGETRF